MCVMNFVSHRGIALILIGRSAIQQVCFFDVNLCVPVQSIFLFVCFVALRPKSTAMVIAGRSVHLTTLFPGQA